MIQSRTSASSSTTSTRATEPDPSGSEAPAYGVAQSLFGVDAVCPRLDDQRQEAVAEALRPLFEAMGRTIVRQGGPGAGQHAKMVNQVLIAGNMVGVCEALLYAHKAGLDPETVLKSVSSGAAGSWSLSNLAPRMIAGDFEPGFFVEHFLKDMGIALAESRRMGLAMPGLALAEQLYRAVEARGMGRKGTQALVLALADLSRVDWKGA